MNRDVKIHFRLEQDDDGYPPVEVESIWAIKGTVENEFVLDNIPFFIRTATVGDTIVALPDDQGNLWFLRTIRKSPNSLVRVVFFQPSAMEEIGAYLVGLGCDVEYFGSHNLLAASIPSSASFTEVQRYLAQESAKGIIDYEEAIIR